MTGSRQITAIDRLLRGTSTGHVQTVRDAWRDLLGEGARAVPEVRARLVSDIWRDRPRGPAAQYFGVLLALLDALDPEAFAEEAARLRVAGLHPLHARTLRVMSGRLTERPAGHIGGGIPVFIAQDIADKAAVLADLQGWSRTRGIALDGIASVSVIARQADMDYLGRYNLFFSGIIMTWPPQQARGLQRWLDRLQAEHTFYHEVGHHACGHLEGGQVAEQEQEADDYARRMLRRSRPVLSGLVRVVRRILRPLLVRRPPDEHRATRPGKG